MRPTANLRQHLWGLTSALCGLFILVSALYVLNKVLPSIQTDRLLSHQFMTLLETEVEADSTETVQPETPQEVESSPEDLLPIDLSSAGEDLSLDAGSLFSVSSSGVGLKGRIMDELNRVEDLSSLDQVPSRLSQGGPLAYPPEARKNGVEGYVTVNLLVAKDGRILKALLLDSEPSGVFEETALSAARSWIFTPPRRNQEAVQVWLKQTIRFDLED